MTEATAPVRALLETVAATHARLDVPVEPDADEARRMLLDELSKPQYAAAEPTWFDLLARSVWDWITSLRIGGGAVEFGFLSLLFVVIAIVVIGAFLLFGVPRLRRRSSVTGPLFGVDEHRTSDQLRAAARAAAKTGDWSTAIEEQFRAVARALQERTILTPAPGTTAQAFARQATTAFPEHATALRSAATAFDDVRYLDHPGAQEQFDQLTELDRALEKTAPILSRRLERSPS